mmetsp:Transcript_16853/g.53411  ORF Transcript_16853/g.53411 Transcript_16853/m.53411 type:complete len:273 (-) Transcript_16853:1619-2437(-)
MRREHDGAPLLGSLDDVPDVAARDGVHSGGGLVEVHHAGVAEESYGHAKAPLHPARVARGAQLRRVRELGGREQAVGLGAHEVGGDAFNEAVDDQVVAPGEGLPQDVELRAHAHLRADLVHTAARGERVAVDESVPRGGVERAREAVDGRCLARSVGPEEAEELVLIDAEPASLDGIEFFEPLAQPQHLHRRAILHLARAVAVHVALAQRLEAFLLRSHVLVDGGLAGGLGDKVGRRNSEVPAHSPVGGHKEVPRGAAHAVLVGQDVVQVQR